VTLQRLDQRRNAWRGAEFGRVPDTRAARQDRQSLDAGVDEDIFQLGLTSQTVDDSRRAAMREIAAE
jgi:hypothetical protein